MEWVKNYSRYRGENEHGLVGDSKETVIEEVVWGQKIKVEQGDKTRNWGTLKY